MLIARFMDGLTGSAFLSVAGGTIGDLLDRNDLQAPMMVYSASPFIGPPVGPLAAGFINYFTSWSIYRPFLLLTFEPMCLNLCLFSALLLGVLYLFFGAFEVVFEENHQFSLWQVGLTFLGLLVGIMIAVGSDPIWHRNYVRLVRNREVNGGEKGGTEPEFRLPPAIAGGILVPIGLFWFGWTTSSSVHWIVPIMGSTVFGAGMLLVFSGVFTFLVDAYPLYAASALAANSFARSSFAAAFPLFGVQSTYFSGTGLGYEVAANLQGADEKVLDVAADGSCIFHSVSVEDSERGESAWNGIGIEIDRQQRADSKPASWVPPASKATKEIGEMHMLFNPHHSSSELYALANQFAEFKYSSLPPVSYCLQTQHWPISKKRARFHRATSANSTLNIPPIPSFLLAPPALHVPPPPPGPSPNSECCFGEFATQPSTLAPALGTNAISTADELLQSRPDLVPSRAPGTGSRWHRRTGAAA
ncbi:MAG: hypothetical protein L6R40_007648 [Gallowayella cf. fulva]|nr:MAG: hypothetical protein L6R40_007648 [Xanthomendoza cf. fulva]